METELSKAYDPTEVEGRWYPIWMERGYFRAEATSDKPPFSIVLPPPNITGSLHLGHALTATLQDILTRWKRMGGFNCLWLPGIDHAGIATQMVVERELKKTQKKSRHDLGRPEFLKRVWEWKEKYGRRIGEQHQVLGASLDWSRERFTMDAASSAAVKEVFVRLHEEGLIYRAQKLINWCPSCRTALSDLEVEHEEKDGSLWHIRYPVKGQDRFLVVATTRPETMLGDTAVAVHPDDPRYRSLIGGKVVLPLVGREIPIIGDAELVNMEFGTGVVKVTPGHDFNDYQTGLRHKLPMISIFDDAARTNDEAFPYGGLDRFDARARVLEDLTAQGLLERVEPHKLSIGTCQRCATVVEPRLSPQWFVRIEPLATPAIEAVEQGRTRFVPESWTQVYFQWMRNIHDWCISRQLWWGHQIPAYYCALCSPRTREKGMSDAPDATIRTGGIDYALSTPIVAREAPRECPKCGGKDFEQDPDVLDTWFSSGLWPFSTLGWPNPTPELSTFYPTSVMETGHDIIFFWVARMMMMGLHFMHDVPFKVVYLHAMVRDEKGEKMSKVKGNVIDPLDVVRGAAGSALAPNLKNKFPEGMPAFGADALRFTLASLTQQGRDIKLSLDRVAGYKAFTNKLWNASRFVLMNLGDFRLGGGLSLSLSLSKDGALTLADRWILSRLSRAIEETGAALDRYDFAGAASTLYQFLWHEFCDWYIELAKGALYGEDPTAKDRTRGVLVYCLDRILRLLHPLMPFITEEIWQKLPLARAAESIMLAPYPRPEPELHDPGAEAEMAPLVAAILGLRNIRGESNLPPATKIRAQIHSSHPEVVTALKRHRAYLMPLAGLEAVDVGPPRAKPTQSASYVGEQMEIFVPLAGLIDLVEERGRLTKELAKVESDLTGLRRKLENANFVARAPPEVVEKDRARVLELSERKAKLEDNLRRIAPEGSMSSEEKKHGQQTDPKTVAEMRPETAQVRIAAAASGDVDLRSELEDELQKVKVPEAEDANVKQALEKLREGTRQGLDSKDHYDLGVAYMGMGLVDDAVREFNAAKADGGGKAKKASAPRAGAAKTAKAPAKAKAPGKAKPAKKAAARRPKAAKKPARSAKSARGKAKKPAQAAKSARAKVKARPAKGKAKARPAKKAGKAKARPAKKTRR